MMVLKYYKGIRINMNSIKILTSVMILSTAIASLKSHRIGFDKYHNHEEMTDYLKKITNEFPNISSLYSIGKSVSKRDLWVVKLTTATDLLSVPNIKIVGNIHGNEPVGKEIILHLIQYLLDNRSENKVINKLLQTTVIHLLPSMNPDGFEKSSPQPCPYSGRALGSFRSSRNNANDIDLNRNFPDTFNPRSTPIQPETKAIMKWLKSVPFIMSLGLHGGTLVANYPYDGSADSYSHIETKSVENLTADDDVFRFLAKQYAKLHPTMHLGQSCKDGKNFKDGIVNGASWYTVTGGMQDYNYVWHGCMEITLELSCCKYPPASFLESHWNDNLKSLITWMQQAHRGIKGIIVDRLTGRPIANATLRIQDRQNIFNTTKNGEYWKILLPGVYKLLVNAAGYDEKIVRVKVPKQDDEMTVDGPRPVTVNVAMEPTTEANRSSTVSNNVQYTYRVSDYGTTELSSATEAGAAATKTRHSAAVTVVEKVELLGSRETERARDEHGGRDYDGDSPEDWPSQLERDDNDRNVDAYNDELHAGNNNNYNNDVDDGSRQSVRPAEPVSSFSTAAVAVHRCCSFSRVAETFAPYLVTYYVTVYHLSH